MLEVQGLTKVYGGKKALDNVSFSVEKGQVVGFLGSNGAGKTTTMDIICGCLGSDSGSVKVAGFDILDQPIKAKAKIGYLPDVPPLYREMTVLESITYAAKINGVPRSQLAQRLKEMIPLVDLGAVQGKLVGSLSKGYRQRVALVHALIHSPDILVLDEPTEGLDPHQIAQIRKVILSLKENCAILLSSHILQEVENVCDQLVIINQGKIVTSGSFDEIAQSFQGSSYILSVRKYEEGIVEALKQLPHVDQVEKREHETVGFELQQADHLDDVARLVLERGWGIKKLAPAASSLEGIFQKATTEEAPVAEATVKETPATEDV